MKKLIIITSKFPYNLTESFLESEYPYLIDKFDKVYDINNLKKKKIIDFHIQVICDIMFNRSVDLLKQLLGEEFFDIEEKINEMINHKKKLANLAVFEGEKVITELTDEEIYEIFSLTGG